MKVKTSCLHIFFVAVESKMPLHEFIIKSRTYDWCVERWTIFAVVRPLHLSHAGEAVALISVTDGGDVE